MQPIYDSIVALTDEFCEKYLNEEYATLCRKLAAALARKRPSPLERGAIAIWACGIVYALGSVNFLFDRSSNPHMRADELCDAFGVNMRSGANKAKAIRDLFKMNYFSVEWTLPSLLELSSLFWMIKVNGVIVDAREMPREIQEIAYQKGLIPYIPADEQGD